MRKCTAPIKFTMLSKKLGALLEEHCCRIGVTLGRRAYASIFARLECEIARWRSLAPRSDRPYEGDPGKEAR